jgi:hypothetical protein
MLPFTKSNRVITRRRVCHVSCVFNSLVIYFERVYNNSIYFAIYLPFPAAPKLYILCSRYLYWFTLNHGDAIYFNGLRILNKMERMVSGDLHVGTFRKFIATSVEVCFITESSAYSTFTKQNIMN